MANRLTWLELAIQRSLIACGSTAAAVHGFDISDSTTLHVTTDDGRSLHTPPGVFAHQMIPRSRTVRVGQRRVIAAPDTVVDLATGCPSLDRLAWLDAGLRFGISPGELAAAVDDAAKRRGIVAVRALTEFASPFAESPMESRTRQRILESGLPAPELQVQVVAGGQSWRLDMGWREYRIGVEYDGEEFHTGTGSLGRDRLRHNALLGSGWTTVHVTKSDVYRSPDSFLRVIKNLFEVDHAVSAGVS